MSIHAALHHVTHYKYDRPVQLGAQIVRLRPAPHCRSHILSYSLQVEPVGHFVNWQQDPFSNYLARLVFPEKVTEFKVTVDLVTEMSVYNPFDFFLEPSAETFPFAYSDAVRQELAPYLQAEPLAGNPLLAAYVNSIDRSEVATINFLVGLNQRVQHDLKYLIRMEPGVQTPEDTLRLKQGSCRDSAWLLVQLLRHSGLAARFVSGYLIQLTPDVKALDGPSGTEVDFTDLHAWCEVYLPGAGWIGLDATSGLLAGEGHIPLACTPQPSSAAPIEGLMEAAKVEFGHEMTISRLYESPRVTLPYSDAQWQQVVALGDAVDQDLQAGDVRLTMGGEPTYVAVNDRDAPEWNTAALGPTKRHFATDLLHKLQAQYGRGGFLHIGQGKWYPGEPLPRWAFSLYWRADGQTLWRNPALLADERAPRHYTAQDAERFVHHLAVELGLPDIAGKPYITPGYEDMWHYLMRERRLPLNVSPLDSRLDDALERERLRRVFAQKLGAVIGYVLPLQAHEEAPDTEEADAQAKNEDSKNSKKAKAERTATQAKAQGWNTGHWYFRDGHMLLTPGDSAMGYRLPLDTLPWVHPQDYPYSIETDPSIAQDALPDADDLYDTLAEQNKAERSARQAAERIAQEFESAHWIPRTALCVQVRPAPDLTQKNKKDGDPSEKDKLETDKPEADKGQDAAQAGAQASDAATPGRNLLFVFMPPVAKLENYLALVQAVESTAQALNLQVVLEGYPPPRDPRLKMLQVTPDPGVIEVNIQPVDRWPELVANTEFLYDAAFQTRLSAEKFMVDGRHTGTGGGNHFVMGGKTPTDSPFLRRPSLLASLLCTWHNHPSLSYLFSGLFIGPTSQAPRVDEARNDQVYELEIALREIERYQPKEKDASAFMPPWLIDRTLRNILIDVTGNTHRSEFCIDKLYSPDSSTGRLGLLELRAFEMPPHARMSVVQQLLLRAFVATYWKNPRITPLTRWGTQLHDQFLLPHFVQQDFNDVLAELRAAGYAFDPAWFAPHFEFRFPIAGSITLKDMRLTLRNALEPWHVMGEENGAGGTVRLVDASLERLQVQVDGFNDQRYVVTVNGRALPLHSTGVAGQFVAGVRYVAWKPHSALHPSIGVHAPLVFDVVDTWAKRAIGGCQYHVAHPGGRNYETFPINANEAESRRLARFLPMGHTPGQWPGAALDTLVASAHVPASKEFPTTLDLR